MALSYAQLEGLWIQAGGPPAVAPIAAAIVYPESGGNPAIVQAGQPYSTTGWGLWQITPGNSVPSVGVDRALLDPLTNARAAVIKFKGAGNSFRPWTTFMNGSYRQYMNGATTPDLNSIAGSGSVDPTPTATNASIGSDITKSIFESLYPVINMTGNLVTFGLLMIGGVLLMGAGIYMLYADTDAARAIKTITPGV